MNTETLRNIRGSSLLDVLVSVSLLGLVLALSTPAISAALRYAFSKSSRLAMQTDALRVASALEQGFGQQEALWCLPLARVLKRAAVNLDSLPGTDSLTAAAVRTEAASSSYCAAPRNYEALLALSLDGARIVRAPGSFNCSEDTRPQPLPALEEALQIVAGRSSTSTPLYLPIEDIRTIYVDPSGTARSYSHISLSSQPLARSVKQLRITPTESTIEISSPDQSRSVAVRLKHQATPEAAFPFCVDVLL